MLVTTTMNIEGFRIKEYLGIARGVVVRSPSLVQGIAGSIRSLLGSQIMSYADLCEQSRKETYELMVENAAEMGANAIIGMRYDTSQVISRYSASEVLCYGTAVVLIKD